MEEDWKLVNLFKNILYSAIIHILRDNVIKSTWTNFRKASYSNLYFK